MPQNNSLQKDELVYGAGNKIVNHVIDAQLEMLKQYAGFYRYSPFEPYTPNENQIVTEDIPCEIIQPKQIENGKQ